MVKIARRSHLQSLRNPSDRHHRLPAQSLRHFHFASVPFGRSTQFLFPPAPALQVLPHDPRSKFYSVR